MPKVNLNTIGTKARPKTKTGFTTLASALTIILVFLALAGIYGFKYYLARRAAQLNSNAQEISSQINSQDLKKTQNLQNRLKSMKTVLDGHTYWTKVIADIEKNTPSSIVLLNFSGDVDTKVLTIEGLAADYETAALYLDQIRESSNIFTSPSLDEASLDRNNNVSFTITATIDENNLKEK